MNKKEAAQTILENLSDDEIKILALEAIERRMKSHDQAGSANALLNKLISPQEKDFTKFFTSFKQAYQYRKEDREDAKGGYKLSPVFANHPIVKDDNDDGRI